MTTTQFTAIAGMETRSADLEEDVFTTRTVRRFRERERGGGGGVGGERERARERGRERRGERYRETETETEFVCWLLNVPATCECISGTDLHRQFYVLPH